MADSLRDQLIAAGYEAPKKEKEKRKPRANSNKGGDRKKNKKGNAGKTHSNRVSDPHDQSKGNSQSRNGLQHKNRNSVAEKDALAQQAIEERKILKARIKALIDENKLEDWKGEVVYRYLVEKRIRELYVTEELQKQLAERAVAVTRLNGNTYLVPREIALSIQKINPQWSVFNIDADTEEESKLKSADSDSDYADYKVPDDLKW